MERPSGLVRHARLMETAEREEANFESTISFGKGCLQATRFLLGLQLAGL